MLSLSMIVRDEAERLERCLRSVAGFVDEMVVVDTGSSDGTVAIAEACGAVVHHLPWPGDFAPARNRALEWVRGDWVLVLDADEWLCPEAREPLQELMADPDALLITLLREERGSRQSPYSSVSRLFRRHPAIRWSRPYHAMVDDSVQELLQREPGWRLLQCGVPALIHDGYRPELLAAGTKAARLRAAMEAELRLHPGDPYASAKLGGLELSEGHREKAIALLEEGLRRCPASSQPERYELLLHLAMARGSGDKSLAASLYREAIALLPDPRLSLAARINLAALLLGEGALDEATALARETTQIAPELAIGWFNLGLIERQRGRPAAAVEAYRAALCIDPEQAETHQNLAVGLLLCGDIPGAREGFRRAIDLLRHQGRDREAADLQQSAGGLVKLDP